MKKRLLSFILSFTCIASASFAQVSVNDVTGSYTGKLEVFFDMSPVPGLVPVGNKENVKVYSTLQDNQKIALTLKDFSLMVGGNEVKVGDIEMKDVTIDNEGNVSAPENTMTHPELGTLPINLTGGKMTATNADLNISVIWVDGGNTPIVVNYIGGTKDINDGTGISSINNTKIKTIITGNTVLLSGAELYNASIYALTGSLVTSINAHDNSISLEGVAKGIYLVHFTTSEGVITRKIVRN